MALGQLVTTAAVPERDRMAFWVEAVCETFLELRVDSGSREDFRGAIETHEVGTLAINFMAFDDQHIARTRQSISRGKRSEFYLIQPRDKALAIEQLGRSIEVEPGGCTLLDSRYPFTIENERDRDTLSIAIPTDWLLTWLPAPEEVVLQRWTPGEHWGGVLAAALSNLSPTSVASMPLMPSVFCDQLGALVAMASGASGPRRVRPSLVDRLRDTIEGASRSIDLDPAEVARHHGISLRYLHLQFAASGTSFGAELLRARLADAQRLLTGPSCRDLPISEVAIRCGFRNSSHFARRFRERYGLSPSEMRDRCWK